MNTSRFLLATPLRAIILVLVAAVPALLPSVAAAQPVKVAEADFATLQKLRYSYALAEARRMFGHTEAQKAAIKTQWEQALKDAGWDQEKFGTVRDAVEEVVNALADMEKGGDEAESAKETLGNADKDTVALVKAHLKEHTPDQELRAKAEKQVRDDAAAEKRGTPPDAKSLEGKWVFDLDATVELNAADLPDEAKQQLRESFTKTMQDATYTFGPGDSMIATIKRDGTERSDKGVYRLEGSKLFVKTEGSKREMSIDIGIKDGKLRIGLMSIYSVFRKA